MENIIVVDSVSSRAVIKRRGLSEGAEAAFERICHEEGMRQDDCQWQEVEKVEVYL